MFQIFLMKKKKKKRKKTTYRRDSRLAQPLAGKHPAHPSLSLVPEIDKKYIEYRGTISATFCPTGGWNGGSTRYWKLQELYLVYTETREGGADNKGERGGTKEGKIIQKKRRWRRKQIKETEDERLKKKKKRKRRNKKI